MAYDPNKFDKFYEQVKVNRKSRRNNPKISSKTFFKKNDFSPGGLNIPGYSPKSTTTASTNMKGILILTGVFLIPLWLLGWSVFIQITKFMNSPIIGGQVPAWAVLAGVVILFMIMRRR